jgi:hypothetical protein
LIEIDRSDRNDRSDRSDRSDRNENYKMENDHYTEYFINRIIYTGEKKDTIGIKSIYEDFKSWFNWRKI